MQANSYAHINANGSAVNLSNHPCQLINVAINNLGASSNTLTLTDDTGSGSGPVIAVIGMTATIGVINYQLQTKFGLTATMSTGTAGDATVVFG